MIRVSPQEVRALASEVNRGSGDLTDIVSKLTAAFNNSSSYWEGNAREQFAQSFQEWNASWGKMNESLQSMQNLIQQWVSKVEELDQAVKSG